jgi:aryl-alcohol dehydrogenase-like predicted oxidoreductase
MLMKSGRGARGFQRRMLGELEVSAVGLGCATMTPFYDEPDEDAAIDILRRAREIGVEFLDSSDAYGRGRNEELIARPVGPITVARFKMGHQLRPRLRRSRLSSSAVSQSR